VQPTDKNQNKHRNSAETCKNEKCAAHKNSNKEESYFQVLFKALSNMANRERQGLRQA